MLDVWWVADALSVEGPQWTLLQDHTHRQTDRQTDTGWPVCVAQLPLPVYVASLQISQWGWGCLLKITVDNWWWHGHEYVVSFISESPCMYQSWQIEHVRVLTWFHCVVVIEPRVASMTSQLKAVVFYISCRNSTWNSSIFNNTVIIICIEWPAVVWFCELTAKPSGL